MCLPRNSNGISELEKERDMMLASRIAVCAVALIASITVSQTVAADQLTPPPTTGTATGTYRTGLTKAGLVQLTSLGNVRLSVRTVSPGDAKGAFDFQVELLRNGIPVASGLSRCVGNLAGPTQTPTAITVPWIAFASPALATGDVLSLRASVRVGTNANGSRCSSKAGSDGISLFYDSTQTPSRLAVQQHRRLLVRRWERVAIVRHVEPRRAGRLRERPHPRSPQQPARARS